MLKIKVRYYYEDMPKLEQFEDSDCIDLRVCDIINLPAFRFNDGGWDIYPGEEIFVDLGVSIELPEGYRANIYPRSSLWKKHGLILTNSVGVIDNSYKGDNDRWMGWLYCIGRPDQRHTFLKKYERILQFEIVPVMPKVYLKEVEHLGNKDRGGFGKTGRI